MLNGSPKLGLAVLLIPLLILLAPYGIAEDEQELPETPEAGVVVAEETETGEPVPLLVTGLLAGGDILVPAAQLFELLGAGMVWDGQAQAVTGIKGATSITLTLDSPVARVDHRELPLVNPAAWLEEQIWIPARFVGEALGMDAVWDETLPAVILTTGELQIFIGPGYQQPEPGQGQLIQRPEDLLALVNKQHWLSAQYIPPDLVTPDIPFAQGSVNRQMRAEAARALEQLVAQAKEAGIQLAGVSGYRSYQYQEALFARNARLKGEEVANMSSARPGQSEHQLGLAMDVASPSVNYRLEEEFGATPEGEWLAQNAADFGFIIRYPQEMTHITGYIYEPWHLRYVGVETAKEITAAGLTLEEYLYAKEFKAKVWQQYGVEL